MSELAQKKKVGRPKKSPTINPTKFKGIGTETNPVRPTDSGVVEWVYTEIKTFNNFMKTLKSCEIETIKLYFLRDKIIIEGAFGHYAKSPKNERKTKIIIDANDTFSYYILRPIKFTINMSEWNTSLEDMDESCNEFKIVYRNGDYFNITIKNASIVCAITNNIKIEKIDQDDLVIDNTINNVLKNYVAKMININSNNLKAFLGKISRKNSQDATFQLRKNNCQIDFKLVSEKIQTVIFDVFEEGSVRQPNRNTSKSKEQFYVISKSENIYNTKFPNIEIHKFLLHMKNDMVEIYFSSDSIVVEVAKPRVVVQDNLTNEEIAALPPHSTFTYYIPLANRS
jgi:hypothetical protein